MKSYAPKTYFHKTQFKSLATQCVSTKTLYSSQVCLMIYIYIYIHVCNLFSYQKIIVNKHYY